ncbi:hypothetical protein TUBRATIS_20250 [Tubulinosema ratisbonensis]|uniref:Uncharacterized protein n=1 Tax=Tubulinosema ratisbonensis TaxID=291195 RepID=A0A437AKD9_9MICR|nr:hypothetical protein TUBRATIS_20250 [Tubulinosema ratisbonensis]
MNFTPYNFNTDNLKEDNFYNENNNKKIFKSPLPISQFTLTFKQIKELEKRKKIFPLKRMEMCDELGLTLYQFQKIEKKFIGYGMTGILFIMKEYKISKEYEFILHDFLFKNIRFINKD